MNGIYLLLYGCMKSNWIYPHSPKKLPNFHSKEYLNKIAKFFVVAI